MMSQVKYPDFENFQSSNQPSQDQGLSQQLVEKPNENITFTPPNPLYQQHQVIPNAEYNSRYLVPIVISENSNLLKDQDFKKQKVFLCGILGVFILWSILFVFSFQQLEKYIIVNTPFENRTIPCILIILSSFIIILLARFGISQNQRNFLPSILILFGLIISYIFFYFALFSATYISMDDFYSWYLIIWILIICFWIGNFLFNLILLVCLIFAGNLSGLYYAIPLQLLGICIFAIMTNLFVLLSIFILLPYAICLTNAFIQIMNGRFHLKMDQVISGAVATFYSLIVCFSN